MNAGNMAWVATPTNGGQLQLAHRWTLSLESCTSRELITHFIRPTVRAVPSSMAQRLGSCRISLPAEVEAEAASRWTITDEVIEVSVATAGIEEHDVAMELLLCFGQALWEKLPDAELREYWTLLRDEIDMGIEGEIDGQALDAKRSLFKTRSHAKSTERLAHYGRASFAGTAAEYVHSLWHDVTIRSGPDYLPAPALRRRLELFARWFPPDRGYRLFPAARRHEWQHTP